MKRLALLIPFALAACNSPSDDPGVSSSEARQLNEAAAMLDSNSVSTETIDLEQSQGNTQ